MVRMRYETAELASLIQLEIDLGVILQVEYLYPNDRKEPTTNCCLGLDYFYCFSYDREGVAHSTLD
jgi:hypothetical protein